MRRLKLLVATLLLFASTSCAPIGAPIRPAVGYLSGGVLIVVVPDCIEPRDFVEVGNDREVLWTGTTRNPAGERQLRLDGRHFVTEDPPFDLSNTVSVYISSVDDTRQEGVFTMDWVPEEYPEILPGEAYDFARDRTVKISEYVSDDRSCDPL